MALTLRLSDAENAALREQAARDGLSMQEVARLAITEYIDRSAHRSRVDAASERVRSTHADALRRLGE